jgi:hypothetical protein
LIFLSAYFLARYWLKGGAAQRARPDDKIVCNYRT